MNSNRVSDLRRTAMLDTLHEKASDQHRLNLRLIPNCSAGISLPTKPAALRVNSSKGLRIRCCVVTIAALVLGVVLSTSRDAEAQSTFTSSDRIVLFGPFES